MGDSRSHPRNHPVKPETAAIHIPAKHYDGAIAPPIHPTTTFEHGPGNELTHGYLYVRHANPNVDDLEARLAVLEGGIGAVAFASGVAAGNALLNTLPPGSTVVFHDTLYFDFLTFARTRLADWGITAKIIDCRNETELRNAVHDGAALVWIESPTNPTMDLIDIRAVSAIAAEHGAKTLVDGTFATPVLQKPFELGADYVLHSTTKYMGGHSDALGGALIVKDEAATIDALLTVRKLTGGTPAPFNAWLTSRGLQTLHCRVRNHCSNAMAIAAMLDQHPAVEKVRYPYLPSNPDLVLAESQMSDGGGMVSFDVKGGSEAALRVTAALKLIVNATSLGGIESLIEHRKSVEGPDTTTPENLLRLSVGLEHPDDLIADLEQALDRCAD
jgi:cystathionine gamma-synthase